MRRRRSWVAPPRIWWPAACPSVSLTRLKPSRSKLAEGLVAALTGTVHLAAGTSQLSASVGVAWSKGGQTTADALVARADAAMYESKRLHAAPLD